MKVLITGGTGTAGRILAERLLRDENVDLVRVMGRSEYRTFRFQQEFASDARLEVVSGDVSDARAMSLNTAGMDVVYHLAAMKHVNLVERDPYLATTTNIEGTKNAVEAALAHGIDRFVLLSTDKVVHASSLYGATKLVAERIALAANRVKPIFNVLRSGNILNSSGSVLEVWRAQAPNGFVGVTDPDMTRFIVPKDALANQLRNMLREDPGIVYVPKAEAFRLADLADVFAGLWRGDLDVRVVGRRPGEKQHEELVSSEELARTREADDSFRVLPDAVETPIETVPSSADYVMPKAVLEKLVANELRTDGFI